MAVGVVVPAAGRGSRYGSAENKIWLKVNGRSLLHWTLDAFQKHDRVSTIIVASAASELDRIREEAAGLSKVTAVVEGGNTRAESVGRGLDALPKECEIVLVHDAARPAISQDLISAVINGVETYGAALPGLPVTDTLKRAGDDQLVANTVPRDGLWAVQTPQGALTAHLREAYYILGANVAAYTDEASILESARYPVKLVPGEESNIKVTRPGDLQRMESILSAPDLNSHSSPQFRYPIVRTGFGYDVHQFADGRPLWLGGVNIPHNRGLAGHSDADVLLHAVCDALLGAAAMGDIGVLFPDTDKAHKDRASIEFVQEVRRRLDQAGWTITNVDVALLAEEPRIGPYRPQIVEAIAGGLGIAIDQVNIKATTSETMGFVGRREGMACWALATIQRS
jgi:2-C-methyl-D-erythritol 4-phosphate cytidylyltransferase/2-C-methyl-D-erythritol 2,4-cyclodiphosphate synthase